MRGKNPLTDRRPAPPMPAAIQEVDMPNPVIPPAGQYFPPRGNSIQPLNTNFIRTDDVPPHGMSYGAQSAMIPPRPGTAGTALPYPPGGRPGSSNGLNPGNYGPMRPSSAAGYGPQPQPRPFSGGRLANRPSSIAAGGPGMIPPAGTYPPGPPPRTNTAMGSLGGNLGPGGPNAGFQKPSGSGGPPPGPGRMPYPGPQGHPPNNSFKPDGQFGPDGKHRPPPVDIGFVAPDVKPPRSPGPRAPPSGTMSSGQGGRLPVGNGPQTPLSPSGKPTLPNSPSPSGAPWSAQAPSTPQSEPAPAPVAATPPPAPAKPPTAGKGPKTFEEMGVPQQQKDQDCVCFPDPPSCAQSNTRPGYHVEVFFILQSL
jgi:hypothetical protein